MRPCMAGAKHAYMPPYERPLHTWGCYHIAYNKAEGGEPFMVDTW